MECLLVNRRLGLPGEGGGVQGRADLFTGLETVRMDKGSEVRGASFAELIFNKGFTCLK